MELKAAFLAMQSFLLSLQGDNTTAIACVNNKGGTRSPHLVSLALEMWEWCEAKDIFVIATHILVRDNVSADTESRIFKDMREWKLNLAIIQPFLQNCRTDLFASRLTTQLQKYISWRSDPGSTTTINKGYAFPLFNLISKTLEKVVIDEAEIILVAPVWQAQHWWPVLLQLLISQPVLLPNNPDLLLGPSDRKKNHPMYPRLHLVVFHISTIATKHRAFRKTLPTYLSQRLVPPHTKLRNQVGTVGAAAWTTS